MVFETCVNVSHVITFCEWERPFDLSAINTNSIVLLSLGGGNTGPAYNTFANGFNVTSNAVLKVNVINP